MVMFYHLLVAALLDDAEPRHTRQLAHRGVDGTWFKLRLIITISSFELGGGRCGRHIAERGEGEEHGCAVVICFVAVRLEASGQV